MKRYFALESKRSRKRHEEGGLAIDLGRRVGFVGQEGEAHSEKDRIYDRKY